MRTPARLLSLSFLLLAACEKAPETTTTPEPAAQPEATPAAAPAEPTAEQKAEEERKKAETASAERLKKMEEAAATEAARWTDAMRADAKKLAETAWPSSKAALKKILASSHRVPGNADRDAFRRPAEMVEFFKIKPNMTVLELDVGGGWWTEVFAPLLAKKGKLLVNSADPNGPAAEYRTYAAKRLRLFLDKSPELFGKVEVLVTNDPKQPNFGPADSLDVVFTARSAHNWFGSGTLEPNLAAAFAALKPGGVLAVEAHRGKEGDDPAKTADKGYLPEAFVIEKAKAAGFELAEKSELNANPKDTKDAPDGVWSLPPTLSGGDKDKDKYLAIGESDRMTLRFVKPKAKKGVAAAPAADKAAAAPAADKPAAEKPAAEKAADKAAAAPKTPG